MSKPPFFIVGCGRSGTTSLTRILNMASNGVCLVEPTPNLNVETRLAMEGRLENPLKVIEETIIRRVRENQSADRVYGEKNVTFAPFIKALYEALNCKFVFIHRDGRNVVRSLMNWHNLKFGTIYREAPDTEGMSSKAIRNAGQLLIQHDTSDYSRPRPLPGEPFYDEWEHFSRFQMCAYYWSRINDLHLAQLSGLPKESWISIDYTSPTSDEVLKVANFCNLEGLKKGMVEEMLENRINSLAERGDQFTNTYPDWRNWDSGERDSFDEIAAKTMGALKYSSHLNSYWKPTYFGRWWQDNGADYEFFKWMHSSRAKLHHDFLSWLDSFDNSEGPMEKIADYGCGLAVGYTEALADRCYFGVDISQTNIDWCRRSYSNPNHTFLIMDFIAEDLPEPSDVVFSMGTIDNVYDIDGFLRAMVRNSKKWIYLTAYRGWFPDLDEHKYSWNPDHQCFYNDLSPHRARRTLQQLGCTDIIIKPTPTGRTHPHARHETLIIARVPRNREL